MSWRERSMEHERHLICKAVIMDLDGALVDPGQADVRGWSRWATRCSVDPEAVGKFAVGRRAADVAREFAPHLDAKEQAQELFEEMMQPWARAELARRADPETLFAALPPSSWAFLSSCTKELVKLRVSRTGLPLPWALVCAEDVSTGNPDPEGHLRAATLLGCPPEDCVAIEGTRPGAEAAHRAGMQTIILPSDRDSGPTEQVPIYSHALSEAEVHARTLSEIAVEGIRPRTGSGLEIRLLVSAGKG